MCQKEKTLYNIHNYVHNYILYITYIIIYNIYIKFNETE